MEETVKLSHLLVHIAIGLTLWALLGAALWWMRFQWHECRDAGLSFWYCVQHIAG